MGRNWKNLSGEDNWSNLLEPLDIDLRRYIIHYGQMAQVTADAFNSEKVSKHAGGCLYNRSNLLSKVEFEQGNPYKYKVTKYLYATSSVDLPSFLVKSLSREAWSKESNWIGYVAVATEEGKAALGRRDIVLAWRGTSQAMEWLNDLKFDKVSAPDLFKGDHHVKIQHGWHSIYTTCDPKSSFNKSSAREQVLEEVRRLIELHKNEDVSITVVGHSLGGALATLNAVDIVVNGYNHEFLVTAFVFGSPRVGDSSFKHVFNALGDNIRVLRIENASDVVPHYPLRTKMLCFLRDIGYSHVGKVVRIDTCKSPYLKQPGDVQKWHDLETYLHGIAGTHGDKGGFNLVVPRAIALVNKNTDSLNDEFHVPGDWWVRKNKGMVRVANGLWLLIDHEEEDDGDCGDVELLVVDNGKYDHSDDVDDDKIVVDVGTSK